MNEIGQDQGVTTKFNFGATSHNDKRYVDSKLYYYWTNNKALFVKAKWMRDNVSQRWMNDDYPASFERANASQVNLSAVTFIVLSWRCWVYCKVYLRSQTEIRNVVRSQTEPYELWHEHKRGVIYREPKKWIIAYVKNLLWIFLNNFA